MDIETAPAQVYTWGLFDQNIGINQVIQPSRMICFAAKWLDQKSVIFRSEFHHGKELMLFDLHALLNEADVVCGYNSRKFDMKHINRELFLAELEPPSPYKQIDLMLVAKQQFAFMSNKLQFILTETKVGAKIEHEGFALWEACMQGDAAAWGRMQRYCENDTKETEKLYLHMLPWIQNHPSHGSFTGTDVCPNCGSTQLQSRGIATTQTGQYQRLHCQNCGRWTRATQRNAKTNIVGLNA